jgi:hypothetical protein
MNKNIKWFISLILVFCFLTLIGPLFTIRNIINLFNPPSFIPTGGCFSTYYGWPLTFYLKNTCGYTETSLLFFAIDLPIDVIILALICVLNKKIKIKKVFTILIVLFIFLAITFIVRFDESMTAVRLLFSHDVLISP